MPLLKRDDRQVEISWKEALEWIKENVQSVKPENMVIAGSPYVSNEENYLLAKLGLSVGAKLEVSHPLIGDTKTFRPKNGQPAFTIEKEKAPNATGIQMIFKISENRIDENLKASKLALIFGSDNLSDLKDGLPEKFIVTGHYENDITRMADLVLPAAMFCETSGTFTNKDGLTQKFYRAIHLTGDIKEGWKIIQEIANTLELKWNYESSAQIAKEMFEKISAFQVSGLSGLYPAMNEGEMIL
jgi:predicted molibdopterin-dependent oxidoreductase YjgC